MASETDEILKAHNPDAQPKQIDPKWQSLYDRLKNQRDQLIDSNNDLNSKGREINAEAVKQEPAEIGTQEFLQDYALGMASTEQDILAEVMAAIDRIETGTYGKCEVTGEQIPMDRLEAVPWTRCTVEGQKILEERGQATKAGIGALGTSRERGVEQPGPRREEEGSL
jgi:RNA polymerase-binding transcription factor DksA